jgi:hypothetical protein
MLVWPKTLSQLPRQLESESTGWGHCLREDSHYIALDEELLDHNSLHVGMVVRLHAFTSAKRAIVKHKLGG